MRLSIFIIISLYIVGSVAVAMGTIHTGPIDLKHTLFSHTTKRATVAHVFAGSLRDDGGGGSGDEESVYKYVQLVRSKQNERFETEQSARWPRKRDAIHYL